MFNLLKALRDDENGVILSAELAIVGSVLAVGAVTGFNALQKSVDSEMADLAEAMESLDQTYSYSGLHKGCRSNGNGNGKCHAYTAGSEFRDGSFATEVSRKGSIGIDDQTHSQWQLTGGCNACSQCGSQCGAQDSSPCAGECSVSCGGQCGTAGGCGTCGTASYGYAYGSPNQSGCASAGCGSSGYGSSGVPRMRVTETPGTWNVPRTTNEWSSPLRFPELEDPAYSGEFGQSRQQMHVLDCDCPPDCTPAVYEMQTPMNIPASYESAAETPETSTHNATDTPPDAAPKPVAEDKPLPETPPGDSKE